VRRASTLVPAVLFAVLALLPFLPLDGYVLGLATRAIIFAIAALSLDLLLGAGGLVSFGHAAYLAIGAYAVAVLDANGLSDVWAVLPAALAAAALFALATGAVALRTSGVNYIMITLAFAQMLYFFFVALQTYGGDDGTPIDRLELPLLRLGDRTVFYYLVYALLLGVLLLSARLVRSRFGMVLRGCRQNERRLRALGFPTYRYKLAAFTLAGAIAGLAGALFADAELYVSPAIMHWTRSGEIMIMVILGGIGTLFGPVLGAVAFLLLEQVLGGWTTHWPVIFGPVLILVVLFARRGLFGLLAGRGGADG